MRFANNSTKQRGSTPAIFGPERVCRPLRGHESAFQRNPQPTARAFCRATTKLLIDRSAHRRLRVIDHESGPDGDLEQPPVRRGSLLALPESPPLPKVGEARKAGCSSLTPRSHAKRHRHPRVRRRADQNRYRFSGRCGPTRIRFQLVCSLGTARIRRDLIRRPSARTGGRENRKICPAGGISCTVPWFPVAAE